MQFVQLTTAVLAALLSSAAAAPETLAKLPSTFLGCYQDAANRTLTGQYELNPPRGKMDKAICSHFCKGYTYFGMEYGHQCFCGDEITGPTTTIDPSNCDYSCSANPAQDCGGSYAIDIYEYNSSD